MRSQDLLPLGAPPLSPIREALYRAPGPGIAMRDYDLRTRVAAGPDDECYLAARTHGAWETPVFVRRFPSAQLDTPMIEDIKRRSMLRVRGVEQILELARDMETGWGFVVSDIIDGASLRELATALSERGTRLPWAAAAALAHDAMLRLAQLRDAGFVHPGVTPARIRISLWGGLWLCHGRPGPRSAPAWPDLVWDVLRPILALAADGHERALLAELLASPDPEALGVACDAIAERHPEVAALLPLAVVHGADYAAIVPHVDPAALRVLWDLVIELATVSARAPAPGR